MRPLARRLFTLCSAVSLLLCVAVCVLWVRGYCYSRSDGVRVTWDHVHESGDRTDTELALVSGGNVYRGHGGIGVRIERTLYPPGGEAVGFALFRYSARREYLLLDQPGSGGGYYIDYEGDWDWEKLGIRLKQYREGNHVVLEEEGLELLVRWNVVRGGVLPYWLCVTATALPTLGLARRLKRRTWRRVRARRGCCVCCGYDLRASPGRCPECGAAAISN